MAYDPKMPFGDNIIQFNLRSLFSCKMSSFHLVLFSPVLPPLITSCRVGSRRVVSCVLSCLVLSCLVVVLFLTCGCLVLWLSCLVVVLSYHLALWLSGLVLWLSSLVAV